MSLPGAAQNVAVPDIKDLLQSEDRVAIENYLRVLFKTRYATATARRITSKEQARTLHLAIRLEELAKHRPFLEKRGSARGL